jgi:RNA polymerase sigma factor (sigma-70 family)
MCAVVAPPYFSAIELAEACMHDSETLPHRVNHFETLNMPAFESAGSVRTGGPLTWETIYSRLLSDREDQQAWSALCALVARHARRDLGQRGWHIVEDVVADTWASVALSFDRAHGAATFHGFVLGHYWNARRQALRTHERAGVALDDVDLVELSPEEDAPDPRRVEQLRSALQQLPARERTAVVLRYFEDASAAGIGQVLGTTEGNARQIVFRAIQQLRVRMAVTRRPREHCHVAKGTDDVQCESNVRAPLAAHLVARMAPTVARSTPRRGARR